MECGRDKISQNVRTKPAIGAEFQNAIALKSVDEHVVDSRHSPRPSADNSPF